MSIAAPPEPRPRGREAQAAAIVFGVLVVATFAAFFVAQRIKQTPSVIQRFRINTDGPGRIFSPNGDGRRERARILLYLKNTDHVTVSIVNADGDRVRTLVDDRKLVAYHRLGRRGVPWDGRDDAGALVPDGRYRVRITLRDQGRSVIAPDSIMKDTKPPRPRVTAIGPQKPYLPELLPEKGGAVVHFRPALLRPAIHVFRTAPGKPREVLQVPLQPGATSWGWDGRTADGRRVPPGTYLVVPEWRDAAGNLGTAVPLDAHGLPVLGHGKLPGRGGITVRYLAIQPPVLPVKAREPVQLGVDARRHDYSWSVRRLGTTSPRGRSHHRKTKPVVTLDAPGGASGVYLFEARTGTHVARVPFAVQARQAVAGTAAKPHGVLVVLPALTWDGRNAVDDDGDGAPNTLDLGGPAKLARVAAGGGLPVGFTEQEAPALLWLDRSRRRYDLTTDAALALNRGPALAGHRGVLIPGDARWLPSTVRTALRRFVRRGGTVVSLGTDSLRRTVRLDRRGRLVTPSAPKATDLFGAHLGPVQSVKTNLEVFQDDPKLDLFAGSTGLFTDVPAWEPTDKVGEEADLLSNAVTQKPEGKSVVVAVRFGKGLVIRPGFPAFAQRLSPSIDDPAVSALMARMWTLLSR